MKQISNVEEKPFISSFNIFQKACCIKRRGLEGITPPPLTTTLFS
jgi:hypothetical protein